MTSRNFTMLLGVAFLVIGVLGFVPAAHVHPADMPPIRVDSYYGYLLGLFPVNVLHNLVHILFGVFGILAARTMPASISYDRAVAVIYGILAVMGLFPVLDTVFGLVPLFGHDVWLHGVIAVAAAYFGWVAHEAGRPITTATPHPRTT